MYLAIEGIKGSGKSTLASMVHTQLKSIREDFALIRHTGKIPCPSVIEFLNGNFHFLQKSDCWNRFFYSRRAHYSQKNIKANSLIIGDRSIATSYAVRWDKWGNPDKCIRYVDKTENSLMVPDVIVLIDTQPEEAARRINLRIKRDTVQADESLPRLHAIRRNYFEIMNYRPERLKNTQWHIIDGNRNLRHVFDDFTEILNKII